MHRQTAGQAQGQGFGHGPIPLLGIRGIRFLGKDQLCPGLARQSGEFFRGIAAAQDEPAAPVAQIFVQMLKSAQQEREPFFTRIR